MDNRTILVEVVSKSGKPRFAHIDTYSDKDLIIGRNFTRQLKKEFGRNILHWSALKHWRGEWVLRRFLSQEPIKIAVDLGTAKGVSAALLACYADKVYTLDSEEILIANCIWDKFGIKNKIQFLRVPTNEDKTDILKNLDFDFAFIDDQHDYEGAKISFEATEKCGRVLFHDCCNGWPGVKKFVSTLPKEEMTFKNPFAYWKSKQK